MTAIAWVTVAIFAGAYILIATERINRVTAALGGALVVLTLGIVSSEDAFFSQETGVDWDVIFLLLGMMLVVGVLRRTGIFEYMAIRAAKLAGGNPFRVMVLLVLVTAIASALLDNVTTILLVAPLTLLVCERLGLKPIPFLMAEVLASNIGGAATLVGDPPNIIIGSRADLSFTDFLLNMGPIVLVILGCFLVLIRFLFRDALRAKDADPEMLMALDEREAITDTKLLWRSSIIMVGILVGFLLQRQTGVAPSVVALAGAGLMLLVSSVDVRELVADVEWETLLFFIGLFILVGALVHVGALDLVAEQFASLTGGSPIPTFTLLMIGSAVISGVVDNIPYVTAMTPVVASLIEQYPALGEDGALWWVLALGSDLGGNATIIGASANVVVVGIAARSGFAISFYEWMKYGIPTVAMSIALALPYVLLRYA